MLKLLTICTDPLDHKGPAASLVFPLILNTHDVFEYIIVDIDMVLVITVNPDLAASFIPAHCPR
jgi:pentose-5-phosphate-3-epimerase